MSSSPDLRPTPGALPLVVFGPHSLEYDFGPSHPLSPLRFGPGIELLRAVGADQGPWLEPEPATDLELEWLHSSQYVAAVRRFGDDPREAVREPWVGQAYGIGTSDDPPFPGMHKAAASVAGGSIRAMEAILRGDVRHAFHPAGGLHHAMRSRASGFCIYNDVALAIARARREGLRVLYVDFDVHHGDGVQALHYHDPGVMTISFHETGRSLFPGTGFTGELGDGSVAGTSVNVPLEPRTGPDAWLAAVRSIVPTLAACFGPDVVVSQHGADGHAWDPLAHLALTTTVMSEAARLVAGVAYWQAGDRWLATGGGGYSVFRVVPRAWALTWLAMAGREIPGGSEGELPAEWREKWAGPARQREGGEMPGRFLDEQGAVFGRMVSSEAAAKDEETVRLVRLLTVPALVRAAEREGWWPLDGPRRRLTAPDAAPAAEAPPAVEGGVAEPARVESGVAEPEVRVLTVEAAARLRLSPRVLSPAIPEEARMILLSALRSGGVAAGAIAGEWLVGVAVATPVPGPGAGEVLELAAIGVAPQWRRRGVAAALIRAFAAEADRRGVAMVALHTVAERDPFDPLPREVRRGVAERLLRSAGFTIGKPPAAIAPFDQRAFTAVRVPSSASPELVELAGSARAALERP